MGHANRRLRLVHVLPARAAGTEKIDADVLLGNLELILFIGLGKHDHGRRGRMDTTLSLRLRHPLDAMAA